MFLMLKTVYMLFSYKQNFYKQHQAEIDKNQANAKQRDWNFAVSKLFTFFIHVKNKCVCRDCTINHNENEDIVVIIYFNPYIYYIYINLNNSSYLLASCLLYIFFKFCLFSFWLF